MSLYFCFGILILFSISHKYNSVVHAKCPILLDISLSNLRREKGEIIRISK